MEWNIEIKDILSNETNLYIICQDKVTVGRLPENDITVNNEYLSGHHITLIHKEGLFYVKDNRSSNGTLLHVKSKWNPVKGQKKVELPLQLKLAKAVIISIHGSFCESQISNISCLEHEEAIMVLDLCDSTKTAYDSNRLAFHLVKRLHAISKPILYSVQVNFFKGTGDGFLATFATTDAAFYASRKILEALKERNERTQNPRIHIKIALHKGKTYIIDPVTRDIQGNDTNITFRMEGLQKGDFKKLENVFPEFDRILCSKVFFEDLTSIAPAICKTKTYCGRAKLKGIKGLVDIYYLN